MKKKILSLVVVLALAFTALGSTLAYFTDAENVTNTFTVGSVDIDLLESKYYTNVDKDITDADIRSSAEGYKNYLENEAGKNVVPGREFMKAIYIDNVGNNSAYVRVRMEVTPNQFKSFYFYENTTALENGELTKTIIGHKGDTENIYADVTEAKENIANWDKLEYIYTYTTPLAADDLTDISPVWKFMMKNNLNNADVEGLETEIPVYADAIQSEGFETAEAAFAAFENQKNK